MSVRLDAINLSKLPPAWHIANIGQLEGVVKYKVSKNMDMFNSKQFDPPLPQEVELTDEQMLDLYLSLPNKQRNALFVETAQAAEIVGLSQRTIQLWIECRFIQAVMIGRKYKVNLISLREYLKLQSGKATNSW